MKNQIIATAAITFFIAASASAGPVRITPTGVTFADASTQISASGASLWSDNETSIYYNTGDVGIGTKTPSANLQVSGDDGVLFTGTFGVGAIPATGEGVRLMWYPAKAAFRVGSFLSGQGDETDIGDHSTAMGDNPVASGLNSTAMGVWSIASGESSTAMGIFTTASGNNSTAMGGGVTASGEYSTAMGYFTTAGSFSSTAMGSETTSTGLNSTAMGYLATASGDYSTAMGYATDAISFAETVVGLYNTDYTPVSDTSYESPDRLFVIGNGTSDQLRSDALVVLKNGNVGIGTTTPVSTLAVSGLPTSAPDASGNAGVVCVTNDGNFWLDTDGTNDCQ